MSLVTDLYIGVFYDETSVQLKLQFLVRVLAKQDQELHTLYNALLAADPELKQQELLTEFLQRLFSDDDFASEVLRTTIYHLPLIPELITPCLFQLYQTHEDLKYTALRLINLSGTLPVWFDSESASVAEVIDLAIFLDSLGRLGITPALMRMRDEEHLLRLIPLTLRAAKAMMNNSLVGESVRQLATELSFERLNSTDIVIRLSPYVAPELLQELMTANLQGKKTLLISLLTLSPNILPPIVLNLAPDTWQKLIK